MVVTKEQLLKYFREENANFSFEKFFKDDNTDDRGVIIITSNQILKTRNIKNNDSLDRNVTYNYLNRLIYEILFDENGVMIQDKDQIE